MWLSFWVGRAIMVCVEMALGTVLQKWCAKAKGKAARMNVLSAERGMECLQITIMIVLVFIALMTV